MQPFWLRTESIHFARDFRAALADRKIFVRRNNFAEFYRADLSIGPRRAKETELRKNEVCFFMQLCYSYVSKSN